MLALVVAAADTSSSLLVTQHRLGRMVANVAVAIRSPSKMSKRANV